jgi:hypothetical protein
VGAEVKAAEVVWESDRRLSAMALRACGAITGIGLLVPAVLVVLYVSAGWGEVGNPWWNPMMAALVIGVPAAAIAGPIGAQGGVHAGVTADGLLRVHRSRKTSETDLSAFDRVTVKREVSRGYRGSTVHITVVNGWVSGRRGPTRVDIGVLSRADEKALREAIRSVRGTTRPSG